MYVCIRIELNHYYYQLHPAEFFRSHPITFREKKKGRILFGQTSYNPSNRSGAIEANVHKTDRQYSENQLFVFKGAENVEVRQNRFYFTVTAMRESKNITHDIT
jgi:hypothetical protein